MLSHFSLFQLFVTPWTVAYQTPLLMRFSQQEYCNGLPCPPPGRRISSPPRDQTHLPSFLHCQVGSLSLAPPGVVRKLIVYKLKVPGRVSCWGPLMDWNLVVWLTIRK